MDLPRDRIKRRCEPRVPSSYARERSPKGKPLCVGQLHLFRQGARAADRVRRPDEATAKAGFKVRAHGFRWAFREGAAEQTNVAREVAETSLAHIAGHATEPPYRRGDFIAKRRQIMDAWARATPAPKVTLGCRPRTTLI